MKKNGCLTWIIGFFVVCLLIGLYSLAWIPAIGFIIYYLIKKDYSGTRKRNFIISIILTIYLGYKFFKPYRYSGRLGKNNFRCFRNC